MRRRRNSMKEYAREQVVNYVTKKLRNRWMSLCPPLANPMRFYEVVFSDDDMHAIKRLGKQYPGLINTRDRLQFHLRRHANVENYNVATICLRLGEIVYLPDTSGWSGVNSPCKFYFEDIPDVELKAELVRYTITEMRLTREFNDVMNALEKVFKVCTTFGQIVRIWPSLEPMLTPDAKRKLKGQKVKSRLPPSVYLVGPKEPGDYGDDDDDKVARKDWVLKPEFSEETLRPFNHLICEATLFPDVDWERNVTISTTA